jgi:hypothetical protein
MDTYTNKTDGTKAAVNRQKKSFFSNANLSYPETVFLSPLDTYFIINCELGTKLIIVIPSLDMIKKALAKEEIKKIKIEINGSFNNGDIIIKPLACDKFNGDNHGDSYNLNSSLAEFTINENNTWIGTNIEKI